MLGKPVNVEQAGLFAATRTTYKQFCNGVPQEEVRANGINRLNYESLEPAQQAEFKRIMHAQQISNLELLQSLSPEAEVAFCNGLDRAVTRTVLAFVEAHPELFEPSEPELPKPIEIGNGGRPRHSSVLMEGLYAGTLRVYDPKVQAGIEQLRSGVSDVGTFEWHLMRCPEPIPGVRWQLNKLDVELGQMDDPGDCYGPDAETVLQSPIDCRY